MTDSHGVSITQKERINYKVTNLVMRVMHGERELWYSKKMGHHPMGYVYDVYGGGKAIIRGFDVELTLTYNVGEI